MRKQSAEAVRAREAIGGYVVTGMRDTPISSSGLFDDWGEARFSADECAAWNGEAALFLIPSRRPPWVAGGNRPGWLDPFNHFAGPVVWRVGIQSSVELTGGLSWRVLSECGERIASGAQPFCACPALGSRQVSEIHVVLSPGAYRLEAEYGETRNAWPVWVVEPPGPIAAHLRDPLFLFAGLTVSTGSATISSVPGTFEGVACLTGEGTRPAPFWREAAYEFNDEGFWAEVPFARRWSRLLPVCGDRVLDPEWLRAEVGSFEVLMNRVDTRTYVDSPVLVRCGRGLVTTLRPFGGLGNQPTSIDVNPAGFELLRTLLGNLATKAL